MIRLEFLSCLSVAAFMLSGCGGGAHDTRSAGSDSGSASGPKTVVVDGSSTVFRISKAAQIGYNKLNPDIEVVVESHGTGGGFGRYLQGKWRSITISEELKAKG